MTPSATEILLGNVCAEKSILLSFGFLSRGAVS